MPEPLPLGESGASSVRGGSDRRGSAACARAKFPGISPQLVETRRIAVAATGAISGSNGSFWRRRPRTR